MTGQCPSTQLTQHRKAKDNLFGALLTMLRALDLYSAQSTRLSRNCTSCLPASLKYGILQILGIAHSMICIRQTTHEQDDRGIDVKIFA